MHPLFALFADAADSIATARATVTTPTLWDALPFHVAATLIFGLIGIALAILGFKVFDWLTPGSLEDEILKKQNMAAAILGGAMILGICLIISRVVGS